MAETGLLGPVLGGVPQLASFANMIKLEAALGIAPDPVRRLGALARARWSRMPSGCGSGCGSPMSNTSGSQRWRTAGGASRRRSDEQAARALLYRLGPEHFADRVLLAWTRSPAGAADAAWRALATLPQRWTAPAFPLRAADFIARGVPKGPRLGAALRAAEEAWIAADFQVDDTSLNAVVEAGIAASRDVNHAQG